MFADFSITPEDLLGQGGEAEVYALDSARVLRIYKAGAPIAYIERRHAFYAELGKRQPPFELPEVFDTGMAEGRYYTIERRMTGQAFAAVYPKLTGSEREQALTSYLDTVEQIGMLEFPNGSYGEILAPAEPLQRDTWQEFVWDRIQQTLAASRGDLEQDLPELEDVIEHFRSELAALETSEKRLIHGDYFPGNCYIDDRLNVCGVGDFGYTTVIGDPRLDLAGAVAYLEVAGGYDPEDTNFLMRLLVERYSTGITRWINFYRLYCAFYFSVCKHDDPITYAWSLRNLGSFRNYLKMGV